MSAKKPKILVIPGSLRKDSFNKRLAKIAMKGAEDAGAEVEFIDLSDYPMPIYDGDIEEREGIPENGKKLKKKMIEADGFIFASPEYNSSISGVLKNAIDWASRPSDKDEEFLIAFKGKTALIISASPGNLGGLRGLVHLRDILGNIFVHVIPEQKAIDTAHEKFDGECLKDEKLQSSIVNLGKKLAEITAKLI
ncbi:MAG: NAD(P)H-dependent oxidoreductase [Chlamydiia bacterium]|nr:NAD(P)H-dependent oxidoreductase [Chlamydiia bacterium]